MSSLNNSIILEDYKDATSEYAPSHYSKKYHPAIKSPLKKSQYKQGQDFFKSKLANGNADDLSQKDQISETSKRNSITTTIKQEQINIEVGNWDRLDVIIKRIKFMSYIKKFLVQSRMRLFRLLTLQQAQMINDNGSYFQSLDKRGKQLFAGNFKQTNSYLATILIKCLSQFPIFSPTNRLLDIWQLIKIISFLVCFYFYLICFAFNQKIESLLAQITSRYVQFLLLPIILRHDDLNLIIKKMKNKFLLQKKTQNIIELVNLIKNIFLLSHLFACIWILAAKISEDIPSYQQKQVKSGSSPAYSTWINLMNIQDESWDVQYIYSYYFITVTMTTVGYGDVRPTNPLEVGVCSFLMMICCFMFGFTINSIGEIFQNFFIKEKNILQKRSVIAGYMNRKEISASTQKSIFEYLEYYWREEMDENIEETNKILNQLSNNLNQELLLESNKLILQNNKILKENFSQELLIKCLPYIQEQNCTPGEIIIDDRIGNVECYIYFVQQGELEVFYYNQSKNNQRFKQSESNVLKKLIKGNNFGQISFFSGQKNSLSIKSVNFSTLLKLKRSDFIQVLQHYQQEYETFCMIKDRIIFSGFKTQLQDKCAACGDITHTEVNCPILHFIPKKFKIIQQDLVSTPHDGRDSQFIRKSQKMNSISYLEFILHRYLEFIEEKSDLIENYEEEYFQFTYFKKNNTSFNEINDLFEDDKDNTGMNISIAQQTKPSVSAERVSIVSNKDNMSDQSHSDRNKARNAFVKRFSQYKLQKTQDIEECEETSSKYVNSQKSELDLDKDVYQQIGQSLKNEKKDQKSKKKITTIVINTHSQKHITGDLENIQEINSPIHQERSSKKLTQFMLNQTSSKDIISLNQQINKDKKIPSLNALPAQVIQAIQKQQTEANLQIQFDVFDGHFEKLFQFKNYFPNFNFKEIIQQLNGQIYKIKMGISANLIKKDNRLHKKRRNGQNISVLMMNKHAQKITNKQLNYINTETLMKLSQTKIKLQLNPNDLQQSEQNKDEISLSNSIYNYDKIIEDYSKKGSANVQYQFDIEPPEEDEEKNNFKKIPADLKVKRSYQNDESQELNLLDKGSTYKFQQIKGQGSSHSTAVLNDQFN
ncbi:cation channel family protein (macronuclear) [Tetrahymena thermophila SB210]|uniref:Cation channel family protein n=1 Tax=Tetrahymena thermophila (strain SB210) TaxID=312017 RepID=Q233Q1_TETTS|nr:cation channel family protein [Tetrahymena thermophila SB210]EAR91778.2 cation channel family protein [Tetrahymena thermophila SB210]|eukprot:XP_001012023.2 cation channel family protein [Tetrahymena thermophila SB210]